MSERQYASQYQYETIVKPYLKELIEELLKEKREETKKIQEIWNDEGDFTLDEKFDIIVGFLDNQIKKWEKKHND